MNFYQLRNIIQLKGGYPIIFESNIFHNSHLIQNCIQNQQQLLNLYTFLNQIRVVKNIRHKDDMMNSLLFLEILMYNDFSCICYDQYI